MKWANAILVTAAIGGMALAACSSDPSEGDGGASGSVKSAHERWPVDPMTGFRAAQFGPVPPLPTWEDNPASDAKHKLGHALFSDTRLSGSGEAICGNCHLPVTDFQSGTPLDAPDRSWPLTAPTLHRNAPSLLNIIYAPMMRWDGSHFTDLYDAMVLPFAEPNMNLTPGIPSEDNHTVDIPLAQKTLYKKLTEEAPGYVQWFEQAFGEDIRTKSPEEVWRLAGKAMAAYIRVAVSRDAPFDAWNGGDDSAMSEKAVRGFELFTGKAGCANCHSGPLFSDFQFHNVNTDIPDAKGHRHDGGRAVVTKLETDGGKFLTPMLRSVDLTSPYLHDGSETRLSKVVERKLNPVARDPNEDAMISGLAPLSETEVSELVEFLKALRGKPLSAQSIAQPQQLP